MLENHILRDNVIYGMNSNFNNALDGLSVMIQNIDLNSFTSKNNVPPKVQHVLTNAIFSKSVHDMNVTFDMTPRQKSIFGCLQATHTQVSLLFVLMS